MSRTQPTAVLVYLRICAHVCRKRRIVLRLARTAASGRTMESQSLSSFSAFPLITACERGWCFERQPTDFQSDTRCTRIAAFGAVRMLCNAAYRHCHASLTTDWQWNASPARPGVTGRPARSQLLRRSVTRLLNMARVSSRCVGCR